MTKSKFSEHQIINTSKQVESGRAVAEMCRENSISTLTYFKWKAKYDGMEAADLKLMRDLEEENRQLKRMACGFIVRKTLSKTYLFWRESVNKIV